MCDEGLRGIPSIRMIYCDQNDCKVGLNNIFMASLKYLKRSHDRLVCGDGIANLLVQKVNEINFLSRGG